MIFKELRRYYESAKIFRFFLHHRYIYKSVLWDLVQKRLHLGTFSKPRNIVLKLHAGCNAHCQFCYAQNEGIKHPDQPLTVNDWKNVIDQGKALGSYTVTLSGGEPLIYPYLIDLVEYVKQNKMLPFTTTNALAADRKLLKELEKAGLCALNWSLHGPKEYHDALVGVNGAFDRICEYGEYCANNTGIINIVNHVVTKASIKNQWYAYVWDLMKAKGFRALNLLPICIDSPDKSHLLDQEELIIYDRLAQEHYVLMDTKNYAKPICPAAREDVFVNNFGEVQPCPFIPITFGNIRHTSLKDIFLRIQQHPMFRTERQVCMPARDHAFINTYILPAFSSETLPEHIEVILKQDEKYEMDRNTL